MKSINAKQLYEVSRQKPIELIDVRTPEEFCELRAAGARNVPLSTFDPHAVWNARTAAGDEPIYFICEVGVRSAHACILMTAAGHTNVVNVEDGTQGWAAGGLPAERGD